MNPFPHSRHFCPCRPVAVARPFSMLELIFAMGILLFLGRMMVVLFTSSTQLVSTVDRESALATDMIRFMDRLDSEMRTANFGSKFFLTGSANNSLSGHSELAFSYAVANPDTKGSDLKEPSLSAIPMTIPGWVVRSSVDNMATAYLADESIWGASGNPSSLDDKLNAHSNSWCNDVGYVLCDNHWPDPSANINHPAKAALHRVSKPSTYDPLAPGLYGFTITRYPLGPLPGPPDPEKPLYADYVNFPSTLYSEQELLWAAAGNINAPPELVVKAGNTIIATRVRKGCGPFDGFGQEGFPYFYAWYPETLTPSSDPVPPNPSTTARFRLSKTSYPTMTLPNDPMLPGKPVGTNTDSFLGLIRPSTAVLFGAVYFEVQVASPFDATGFRTSWTPSSNTVADRRAPAYVRVTLGVIPSEERRWTRGELWSDITAGATSLKVLFSGPWAAPKEGVLCIINYNVAVNYRDDTPNNRLDNFETVRYLTVNGTDKNLATFVLESPSRLSQGFKKGDVVVLGRVLTRQIELSSYRREF